MKLSRADQSSLIIAFTEAIQSVQVPYYAYIGMKEEWISQTLSALDEELRTRVQRDTEGLEWFFNREVFKIFFAQGNILPPQKEPKPLASFKGFNEPLKVARYLVNILASLPLQYRAFFECSKIVSENTDEDFDMKISDQLSIVKGAKLAPMVTLQGSSAGLHEFICAAAQTKGYQKEIDREKAYFTYRSSGYVGDKWETRIASDMLDAVRAFYGSAISNDIFWGVNATQQKVSPFVVINELHKHAPELVYTSAVDEDVKRASNLLPKSQTFEALKKGESLRSVLAPVVDVFSSTEYQRMTTAAIWLLRAHMSHRGMDQILESAIAIEVLLGDRETSDRIGLSKLMANRCAYALGRSGEERRNLIELFTRYYKVRSEIVHSGRFKITEDERKIVEDGVNLASRLLRHEVALSHRK